LESNVRELAGNRRSR